MDNGRELVAKIPLPHGSLPHLTCASQVATMDFARSVLKIPTPKVLAWNSRLTDNPIGAEFILMEKLPGVQLSVDWAKLDMAKILRLCTQLATLQNSMLSKTFKNIGAIYYADDLNATSAAPMVYTDEQGKELCDPRFVVGPVIDQTWMLNGRCKLECDRGPWCSTLDYLKTIVARELEAIRTAPDLPTSFELLRGPRTYKPTVQKKHQDSEMYLRLVEHIIPKDSSPLAMFRFWNNHIGFDSVFVEPDDPSKLVGLTGWGQAQIAPLFKHSVWPEFSGWDAIMDLADGDDEEEYQAMETGTTWDWFVRDHAASKKLLLLHNTLDAYNTKRHQELKAGMVVNDADRLFDHTQGYMVWSMYTLLEKWKKPIPYVHRERNTLPPLKLTRRRKRNIRRDLARWASGCNNLEWVFNRLKRPWCSDGATYHKGFTKAKKKLRRLKKKFVGGGVAYEEHWPFDD